jgi:hypothetical protein
VRGKLVPDREMSTAPGRSRRHSRPGRRRGRRRPTVLLPHRILDAGQRARTVVTIGEGIRDTDGCIAQVRGYLIDVHRFAAPRRRGRDPAGCRAVSRHPVPRRRCARSPSARPPVPAEQAGGAPAGWKPSRSPSGRTSSTPHDEHVPLTRDVSCRSQCPIGRGCRAGGAPRPECYDHHGGRAGGVRCARRAVRVRPRRAPRRPG